MRDEKGPFDEREFGRMIAKDMVRGPFTRVTPTPGRYVSYDAPRYPRQFLDDEGEFLPGSEPNGSVFPFHVVDAMAKPGPSEFVAVGEWQYKDILPDGTVSPTVTRRKVDFAMSRAWIEANSNWRDVNGTLVWVCPECEGQGDEHRRILVDGQMVKCPRGGRR